MRKALTVAFCVLAGSAFGQVFDMGDIVVVPDPGGSITALIAGDEPALFPSKQEQFCRAAFNAMRASAHPDVYDGVVSFSASNELSDINNIWQGPSVRSAGSNIGRDWALLTSTYNSSKISQCVFMGTLGTTKSFIPGLTVEPLPADPEKPWRPSIGIPIPIDSLTGIEMMGHEYGHHWLLGIEYDLNDGKGKRGLIRATSSSSGEGSGEMGKPNQHYSAWADSRSVMYGSCITPKGGNSYQLGGCVRKYSHVDQYLMGLRAPDEVDPMLVIEDPSTPGVGVDSIPPATNSSGLTISGTPYMVTGESIVRAMGARMPAYPNAKNCWRMAFIVVLAPGETTLSPTMYRKAERYRQRWSGWFMNATDGRGTMDSRVHGDGCIFGYSPDGGSYVFDAGQPGVDAGTGPVDGGVPDAGETPVVDAGAVTPPRDGGPCIGIGCDDIGIIKPGGCGCGSVSGFELLGALALVIAAARRRLSQ